MAGENLNMEKDLNNTVQTPIILLRSKRPHREYEAQDEDFSSSKERALMLAINKPSYCLKRGNASLQSLHRKTLWRLLTKLLKRRHKCCWAEASGVMAVLLLGTLKDQSPSRNRDKYRAALEILNYIKGEEDVSSRRVQSVYELWMKKIGPLKNWSPKNRFAVQLEFIIFCIQRGSTQDAHQAALCLMQENGFEDDPISNLVVGLAFYQLWYSGLPKELQLGDPDSSGTYMQSEIHVDGIRMSIEISQESDVHGAGEASSHVDRNSNTSIANYERVFVDDCNKRNRLGGIDHNISKETSHCSFQRQAGYMQSAEGSEHSDYSSSKYSGDHTHASVFDAKGLPQWLLPLKLPNSHENWKDALYMHKKLRSDYYKCALKHLRVALHSIPPVIEAFHPLMQLLLLGDQVQEALDELENLSQSSDTVLQLRLKANLLEQFDSRNLAKLCTCYEDILKKDPTCSNSLAKLVIMHRRGDYETHNLAEVIGLHLDVMQGIRDTWKELASCFLKLSQCNRDKVSTSDAYCPEYLVNSYKNPELFIMGDSGKTWRFRCTWWLNRHFHSKILMADIASGDLELLTYKASAASHIYGRDFIYVVRTIECLEKENKMELYSFLQTQILNSVGFHSVKSTS